MIRARISPESHRVFYDVDNLTEKHKRAIRNALFDIGIKSKYDSIKNIKYGTKSGRIYPRGAFVHRASRKGESPADDTGHLARSLDYGVTGFTECMFGYTEEYGFYLEKGTEKDGSVAIAPRPNLSKVQESNAQQLINYMVKHFTKDSK